MQRQVRLVASAGGGHPSVLDTKGKRWPVSMGECTSYYQLWLILMYSAAGRHCSYETKAKAGGSGPDEDHSASSAVQWFPPPASF